MPDTTSLIRLFVSSTFADFAIERDILQRIVFPRIRQLCAEQGFRFQPIDLRWGVSQEAGNEKRTLSICFEEIRRCQQLSPDLNFLILLGDRYGSCFLPPNIPSTQVARLLPHLNSEDQDIFRDAYREDLNALPPEYVLLPNTARGRNDERLRTALGRAARAAGFSPEEVLPFVASATHLEIQRGLLAAGADPAAVVCALRSFTPTPSSNDAHSYVEQDIARSAQVESLKHTVQERLEGRLQRYAVPWGTNGPVFDREALARQLLDLLVPRLQVVMDARQRARQNRDPVALANATFAAQRAERVEGRKAELVKVATYLAGTVPLPLVLTGAPGSGKSTVLAEVATRLAASAPRTVVLTRYIGITPGTSSLADLMNSLRREIAARYDQPAPEPIADLSQLVETVALTLQTLEIPASRPLILLIDALDQLGTRAQRADYLPRQLAPHVRVVVSVLPDRQELAELRTWLPEEQVLSLGPLDRATGQQVLRHWLAEDARTLTPAQETAVLDAFVAADGSPLYLRVAEEAARRWHSDTPIPILPVTTPVLLTARLDALAAPAQFGEALVRHALGDLAAARDGLAEDELLVILAQDAQVRDELHMLAPDSPPIEADLPLPAVLWARLYAELERLLTEREVSGISLLTFYHGQVRTVVAARCLQRDDALARHQDLAAFFGEQEWQLAPGVWNQRKLAELAAHRAGAGTIDLLRETLTDAQYLKGKLAVEGANAALEDLARLEGDPAVRHIAWVFRGWAAFLEAHPEEVANQVEGRRQGEWVLHHSPWDPGQQERPVLRLLHPTLPGDPALLRSFTDHTDTVITSCALSIDGLRALSGSRNRTLSGSRDGTLRLWDVVSGKELRRFECDDGVVDDCALSADGSRALSVSGDNGTLRLWDVASGTELRRFEGHGDVVWRCALSADGRLALSSSKDQTLRLWDVATGQELRRFKCSMTWSTDCALSADGRLVLSVSDGRLFNGRLLLLWDVATGRELQRFKGHHDMVSYCVLSADGRFALSTSFDRTMRLWDVASGTELRRFEGHTDSVSRCGLSADNRLALSTSCDGTMRLWDVASGQQLRRFNAQDGAGAGAPCALSADGSHILSASSHRYHSGYTSLGANPLRLWDATNRTERGSLERHDGRVLGCTLSADGKRAFSASVDRTIRVWDVASGKEVRRFKRHTSDMTACAWSADGSRALSVSSGRTLRLWDVASGEEVRHFKWRGRIFDCALNADGSRALLACTFGNRDLLQLWDVTRGRDLRRFEGHSKRVYACVLSADCSRALSASADRTVRLWDVASGRELQRFEGHWSSVYACVLSADGSRALSAGQDWTLRLWDVASGRQLYCLEGHAGDVTSCAWSADGSRALSASEDRTIRLWDMSSGKEMAHWRVEEQPVCCALSADGQYAAVGDEIGDFHFLDVVGVPLEQTAERREK